MGFLSGGKPPTSLYLSTEFCDLQHKENCERKTNIPTLFTAWPKKEKRKRDFTSKHFLNKTDASQVT